MLSSGDGVVLSLIWLFFNATAFPAVDTPLWFLVPSSRLLGNRDPQSGHGAVFVL